MKNDNIKISLAPTPDELIAKTKSNVLLMLKKLYPDYIEFDDAWTITHGSAQVMVLVRPFTEKDTIVECIANVVTGANLNEEIMSYLLRKNAELHIGGFGLLFDNTIIFQHSLPGSNLDENELIAAIDSVAIIADYYDNEIIKIAGGVRAIQADEE